MIEVLSPHRADYKERRKNSRDAALRRYIVEERAEDRRRRGVSAAIKGQVTICGPLPSIAN